MSRIALAILLAMTVVLAAMIIVEQNAFRSGPAMWRPALRGQQATSTEAAAPVTDHTREWVTTILDRPLFSPSRRAPPGARNGRDTDIPRLSGVLVSGSERRAIFAGTGNGKPLVANEGARIGAYLVQSINADEVTLSGPGGDQVMRPSFDPAMAPRSPPALGPVSASGQAGQPSLVGLIQKTPLGVQGAQ